MNGKLISFYKMDKIGDEHLQVAVWKLGVSRLVEEINGKIEKTNFSVDFSFSDIEKALNAGDYMDLFLPEHWLVLQKPANLKEVNELKNKIKNLFDVYTFKETDSELHFEFYANEGPYANTINETAFSINEVLGPYITERLAAAGITDYKIKFVISKFC